MMDFATAAKLAGARYTVLRGPLARLERASGSSCSICTRGSMAIRKCGAVAGQRCDGLRHREPAEIRG